MTVHVATPATYVVETSGWDANENFFAEKTELEWVEGEKKIYLRHPVRRGAVLFVRLMGTDERLNGVPVAYAASEVSYFAELRRYGVLLVQLVPRTRTDLPAESSSK